MIEYSELFYYDETSPSCLRWRVDRFSGAKYTTRHIAAGDVAGTKDDEGYWRVNCEGKLHIVSRVIWQITHGKEPSGIIDHISGDTTDNRITNLRDIPVIHNSHNMKQDVRNKTGIAGVCVNNDGKVQAYYCNETGKQVKKSFSIRKYGLECAMELAIKFREEGIKYMNQNGAAYTERHGK